MPIDNYKELYFFLKIGMHYYYYFTGIYCALLVISKYSHCDLVAYSNLD